MRKASIFVCAVLVLGLVGQAVATTVTQLKSYESRSTPGYLNYRAYTDAASGSIEVRIGTEDPDEDNYTIVLLDGAAGASLSIVESDTIKHDASPVDYSQWNTTGWSSDGYCPYYVKVTITGVNNTKINFRIGNPNIPQAGQINADGTFTEDAKDLLHPVGWWGTGGLTENWGSPFGTGLGPAYGIATSSATPVPDVVGMAEADATAAITEAGLTVGATAYECSDTVPAGSVVSQDPPAGTEVDPGSAVNLVVSTGPCTIPVNFDIKPGSCPNPLNVGSRGVIPAAVLGAEDFDVNTIDAVSVRLNGVAPIRHNYEDVSSPVVDGNECECSADGPDGYLDLTLKFDTREVVESLGDVNDGDVLTLTVEGVLTDEIHTIKGTDCIRIIGKHKTLNGADINKDGKVDMADFAIFSENWLQSSMVEIIL